MVNAIGIGDWMGASALLAPSTTATALVPSSTAQAAAATGYGVGVYAPRSVVSLTPDSAPTFRSSVTTLDPIWIVAALVVLYLVFRKA